MSAETKPQVPGSQRKTYIVINDQYYPIQNSITNIGRRLTNHLVIDDTRVSRTHAQIRLLRGRYFIVDLNSTGGTCVNGKRIDQAMLYPGDKISLAGLTLSFLQEDTGMLESSEEYTAPLKNKTKQGRPTSSLPPEPLDTID